MNTPQHHIFIIAILACTLQAAAAESAECEDASMSLALDLDDGSHVIGRPEIKSMPVKTTFANLDIPLGVIQTVNFGDSRESTAIKLQNGDKVTGAIVEANGKLQPAHVGGVSARQAEPFGDLIDESKAAATRAKALGYSARNEVLLNSRTMNQLAKNLGVSADPEVRQRLMKYYAAS
mgnify:CR=1 FL=1